MPGKKEHHLSLLKCETMRELWHLGAPTIVEQALATVVVYVDTAMVGHIGASASAAVGLTTTVNWLITEIFFAVSVSLLCYIARYTGEGDREMAHRTSAQAIWVVLFLTLVEGSLALGFAPFLPRIMGADPEIHHDASLYFFIVSLPMLFKAATAIYGNVLRANKDSRTPMIVNVCVNLLNIVLNQLFIGSGTDLVLGHSAFHIWGAGWGVAGAAIATAVSQTLGGIVIFIVAMKNPATTLKGQPLRPDRRILRRCTKMALPLVGERIVWGIGQIVFSALVAGLGTLSMAAHSIALTIEQAFYVPGYGIQTAVSTLAGNAVGRYDEKGLKEVNKCGMVIAVSIMTLMSSFLFLFSPWIMKIFSSDPDVIALGAKILRVVAVSEPMFAVLIIIEGIFHGIGETMMPFVIGLFTMWGIRIFLTYVFVNFLGCGLVAVWWLMVSDNVARCLLLLFWYRRGRWKKRLGMA